MIGSVKRYVAAARVVVIGCASALLPWVSQAQFSVGESGSPSYSMPIAVPPGIAGMAPKLSLVYTGGVNGPLGYGWGLHGLSTITRCPATIATDGLDQRKPVEFSDQDKLCLDGQRLIQTEASGLPLAFPQSNDAQGLSGTASREFRTEKESYARIRAFGLANKVLTGDSVAADPSTGPAYFKVWTKAGLVYEYGALSQAEQMSGQALVVANAITNNQSKAVAAVWAVRRVTDTLGNAIEFRYEQRDVAWGSGSVAGSPTPGREWNISEVRYASSQIRFHYDVDAQGNDLRPDRAEAYHRGNKNVNVRRLKAITTAIEGAGAGWVPIASVQLEYHQGLATGRSLLSAIRQCAGDLASTRCLPATAFSYSPGFQPALVKATNLDAGLAQAKLSSTDAKYGVLVGDFNGDGLSDILRWAETQAENELWTSKGDGTFVRLGGFNLTGSGGMAPDDHQLFRSDGCYASFIVDVNGDGIADLVRMPSSVDSRTGAACGVQMLSGDMKN